MNNLKISPSHDELLKGPLMSAINATTNMAGKIQKREIDRACILLSFPKLLKHDGLAKLSQGAPSSSRGKKLTRSIQPPITKAQEKNLPTTLFG